MAKRYTPYFEYNFDEFDFDNFLDGGEYRIPQVVLDESLVGRSFIVFDYNFDHRIGEVKRTIPTLVTYKKVRSLWGEHINLLRESDDRLLNNNFYLILENIVYSVENSDLALIDYNNRVETYQRMRKEYLDTEYAKAIKGFDKMFVKKIIGVKK